MVRLATIDKELCNPKKCNWECLNFCPVNRKGQECIKIDKISEIEESLCIGCNICVNKCPRNAIKIVNTPEQLKEEPVHRYGKNQFVLYRLPIPSQNSVVGLLGQNGTGKSTVLNILSGQLEPNLGKKETNWQDVVRLFRGNEIQPYLEKLGKGGIKTAMKPQNINPQKLEGTVRGLLEKIDETGNYHYLIRELELENIQDRNIKKLSGGELQKVAIAATLCKKTDFIFIDEPTSFLDIKQRIGSAKVIRSFRKNKSIMVVEHDLAILDYLSDKIHVLYGSPSSYGVVSSQHSTRVGINSFLEGYIKELNMRFRENAIKFHETAAKKASSKSAYAFAYDNFTKNLGNFSMEVEKGKIGQKEIIGIIGPNGIGKTTFIKELVKSNQLKFSYKPQYIEAENATVEEFLSRSEDFYETYFQRMIQSLGIQKLMKKNLQSLSGGELQRVYILSCLDKNNQLIFLDEPSAFLDVDQRLLIAKILKQFVGEQDTSVFVVDHDLQFIDAVSDKLIVFGGEPGKKGRGQSPTDMRSGMNTLLKDLRVTFRRDEQSKRPRPNKLESVKDREQKNKGEYFYG